MAKRHRAEETREDARNVVHVVLTPEANRTVNFWADRTGAKKTKMVARLLEWFAAAPESMQQVMVGTVPRDMADQYVSLASAFFAEYTRKIASGQWPPPEVPTERDLKGIRVPEQSKAEKKEKRAAG